MEEAQAKLSWFAVIIVFIGVFALNLGAVLTYDFYTRPLVNSDRLIELRMGDSLANFSQSLHAQNLLPHPLFFRYMAHAQGKAAALRAGEYNLSKGSTAADLLTLLVSGKQVLHAFTILEGWHWADLKAALVQSQFLNETSRLEDEAALITALELPHQTLEGAFWPDTYFLAKDTSVMVLLKKSHTLLQNKLNAMWERRTARLTLKNPQEAVILASIIEKETALLEERPLVSGVFHNRLKARMRLQADPTVRYAVKNFKGSLSKKELQSPSAYNTYTHGGLPPTPIAFVSETALLAAMTPLSTPYFYFVADGLKGHIFAINYKAHQNNIKAVQAASVPVTVLPTPPLATGTGVPLQ